LLVALGAVALGGLGDLDGGVVCAAAGSARTALNPIMPR
jgi:hypothetical protein